MNHKDYVALGQKWASLHKQIQHTPEAPRFVRMHLSSDPYQAHLDMKEFLTYLRNTKLRLDMLLVWISYEGKYEDSRADAKIRTAYCSFMVLQAVKRDDWDAQDTVYANTEEIGEELIAAIQHDLLNNPTAARPAMFVDPAHISSEKIGPLPGDLHGTKFNYVIPIPVNQQLTFNPDKFLTA